MFIEDNKSIGGKRLIILGDLISSGLVGVEVVLPIELTSLLDMAAESQGSSYRRKQSPFLECLDKR